MNEGKPINREQLNEERRSLLAHIEDEQQWFWRFSFISWSTSIWRTVSVASFVDLHRLMSSWRIFQSNPMHWFVEVDNSFSSFVHRFVIEAYLNILLWQSLLDMSLRFDLRSIECRDLVWNRKAASDLSVEESSCQTHGDWHRRCLAFDCSKERSVDCLEHHLVLKIDSSGIEMVQDLTEIYAEKMKRVQQKLDNLRKGASGELMNNSSLSQNTASLTRKNRCLSNDCDCNWWRISSWPFAMFMSAMKWPRKLNSDIHSRSV